MVYFSIYVVVSWFFHGEKFKLSHKWTNHIPSPQNLQVQGWYRWRETPNSVIGAHVSLQQSVSLAQEVWWPFLDSVDACTYVTDMLIHINKKSKPSCLNKFYRGVKKYIHFSVLKRGSWVLVKHGKTLEVSLSTRKWWLVSTCDQISQGDSLENASCLYRRSESLLCIPTWAFHLDWHLISPLPLASIHLGNSLRL